MGHHTVLS